MGNEKFYICKTCGNLVHLLDASGVPMMCCGKKMEELVPNTSEGAGEKHLPVYTLNNNVLEVSIGSVLHPMSEAHYIAWVYVECENGGKRKLLKVNEAPKTSFCLYDDKPISIYAYCNLHGLWKSEIK